MLKRLVHIARSEAARIEFRWRPTFVATVFAFALLTSESGTVHWHSELLQCLVGADLAISLVRHGLTQAFAVQVIVPIVAILLIRERLRDYGLALGDVGAGLKITGLFYLLYVPCFLALMLNEPFRDFYSVEADHYADVHAFLSEEVIPTVAFMIQTEFLFRGFALFGLKKDYGPYAATLASLVPFVYFHLDKPAIEAFGSLPVGLALSYLALRTSSIWYGVLLHTTIAVGFVLALILIE
jgi:membrane protease YdiL (CAAX protease family)